MTLNSLPESEYQHEEEKAADAWKRKMAFVLVSHEFGLVFEALAEGLKSKSAELRSPCFVAATWTLKAKHLPCWLSKVSFMTLVWAGTVVHLIKLQVGGVKLGDFSFVGNQTITQLAFRGHEGKFSVYVYASKEKPVHMSRYFLHREIRSDEVVWGKLSMVDTLPEHLMAEFRHGDRVKKLKQRGKESCKKYGVEGLVYQI
ncbi:hypothetical protein V6N13_142988 [Hibiscus sabdariffa]